MGHVLNANLALLMGDFSPSNPAVTDKLEKLQRAKEEKQNLNNWESLHIEAVHHLAEG